MIGVTATQQNIWTIVTLIVLILLPYLWDRFHGKGR